MATFYRPAPVADRAPAPLPRPPHIAQKPPAMPAKTEVKRAPVDLGTLLAKLLPGKSTSSRAKAAAEAAPAPPSLAYAPDLLVNPTEFKDPQFAHRTHILDARFWDFYFPRHVAGSINTDAKEWIAAFAANPSQPSWEKRIAALAIDRTAPVVVYDDGLNKDAASVRAILRYWGFTDVRVLNGGWHAWLAAGGPHDGKAPHPAPQAIQLEPATGLFLTKNQVLSLLPGGSVQIVDACTSMDAEPIADVRSAAENAGSDNVKRLAWVSIVAARRSQTSSAVELARLVRNAGIDVTRQTVVCSESLGEAAGVSYALELLGARNVQICFHGWKPAAAPSTVAGP